MLKKILLGIAVVVLVFAAYVASRPNTFRYERSGVINASPEKIYPYLSDFRLGGQWSPYEKMDPNMKKTYSGPEAGTGSRMEFDSKEAGSGSLEILNTVPNGTVELRLHMTQPMEAINIVTYTLTPEGSGTRFTWAMSGDVNFLGKLVGVVIDCEKMVGDQFSQGIENLKAVVEAAPN